MSGNDAKPHAALTTPGGNSDEDDLHTFTSGSWLLHYYLKNKADKLPFCRIHPIKFHEIETSQSVCISLYGIVSKLLCIQGTQQNAA